ncbi:sensor histidine kinase [Actinoplanes sp. TFC3]|uniref:sensor histidine kinase n=1 Tax=Actinoplanes sp. TFC3 TaxID=1710355 RepID=UPI00083575E3|nr:sensor histidine kinase [Actinoplanes sp. TFC3]
MNSSVGYRPLVWASAAVIAVDAILAGLPEPGAARILLPVLVVAGLALWLAGTSLWIRAAGLSGQAIALTGAGLCGAGIDLVRPDGPGYVLGFMAVAGMGLRLPRRIALICGGLVVACTALVEAYNAQHGITAFLNLAIGGFFLFMASAFAQANRAARDAAEERLAQEAETRAAREESARLAERSRIARELHDVLAHTLAGLTVKLEGARLLATKTSADPRVIEQISGAHSLARDGLSGARQVVETLRGDRVPGPSLIPELVQNSGATLTVTGTPRPMPPEDGLALYRTVQEALTNAAKHAGPSATVAVSLTWTDAAVEVSVTDSGGSPVPQLPSGGFGLTGLAERAALAGGQLTAGPEGAGWRVWLSLPLKGAQ